jgi:uncharacterized protein YktB (UPF0637 family)
MTKSVTINGVEYTIKYSIRALFLFESITGKPFAITSLFDNYIFLYCIILANNKNAVLSWDEYLDALDRDPEIIKQLNTIIKDHQKEEDIFTIEEDVVDDDGNEVKKKEQ